MANTLINLRSWREDRRKERQQRFLTSSVLVAILAAAAVWGTGFYIEHNTKQQQLRNDYLRQEMAKLDSKIKEIKELRAKRERLLERLRAIQELQGNRPVIVRVFDELVRVLPDELYYSNLSRKGESLHVQGRALSNRDVSTLMRNLDRSSWFSEPNLSKVGKSGDLYKNFDMRVGLTKPKPEEEGS
ncbi:pilus assembly protein PilN [Motiliproteus coralliicola]|uniref:Pilus assembly protein PilN n=1 Tax=Motiliproteus coralliicola TaxID=2283196 RepID=A0A369WAS2_9GAMM|nr:PilN domain-containing protein [Motiliproteus coralliicola]RDE19110.1 pilus assembly protein PilN [Motiliproteus coralliicola]